MCTSGLFHSCENNTKMRAIFISVLVNLGLSQAFVPLTQDVTRDQIFVQGNWYNRDGSTNKPVASVTPAAIFQQCLHHENASGCDTTWSQRYWVNTDYYMEGGPIFLELAGEWDAAGDIDGGQWHNYAIEYNASLIVLEHRFYGDSFPVRDPSQEDLWLMTSQAALADAAYFIETYTAENNLNETNWVSFGCSYGGNLAAWFKLKYPALVKTSVASSAPVEAIYDYPGYMKTISEVVEATSLPCYYTIRDVFGCMENLADGSQDSCGIYTHPDNLTEPLRYCYSVDWDGFSKEQLFQYLAMPPWADNAPSAKVRNSCDNFIHSGGANGIERYGNFMAASGHDGGCGSEDVAEERRQFLKTRAAWQSGAAGWSWQTCNEFGYFMSSDPTKLLFGRNTWSGDVFGATCQQNYGPLYTREYVERRVAATNAYYGGKEFDSKCVIFVHGTWDPWHTQGITSYLENNTLVLIPGTEHCADTAPATDQRMRDAHATIMTQIGRYLNDPDC